MKTRIITAAVMVVLGAAALSGCGGKFACRGDIPGTRCETVTSVYEQEMGLKPATPREGKGEKTDQGTAKQPLATPFQAPFYSIAPLLERLATGPETESVLLAPRRVMRVWIAPWESSAGRLHGGEYVYFETTPKRGRWSIGTQELGQDGVRFSDSLLDLKFRSPAGMGLTAPSRQTTQTAPKTQFGDNVVMPGPQGGK